MGAAPLENREPEVRILVCGDRNWNDSAFLRAVLEGSRVSVLIHGAARGADTVADDWAEDRDVTTRAFPADWNQYGKAAGPIRNQQMLDEGKPDLVLAFHDDLAASKGTADMVRRAKKAGVPVYVFAHG